MGVTTCQEAGSKFFQYVHHADAPYQNKPAKTMEEAIAEHNVSDFELAASRGR